MNLLYSKERCQASIFMPNFGCSRPFEAALRKGEQSRLKSRLAANFGGPTQATLSGKLL
jgi:hypothetical protein